MKESRDWRVTSFPFTDSVDVDHMGKMLCVDYFPERNLNITAVLPLHLCISRIRDAGKGFHLPVRKYHFTVGFYKIVQSGP